MLPVLYKYILCFVQWCGVGECRVVVVSLFHIHFIFFMFRSLIIFFVVVVVAAIVNAPPTSSPRAISRNGKTGINNKWRRWNATHGHVIVFVRCHCNGSRSHNSQFYLFSLPFLFCVCIHRRPTNGILHSGYHCLWILKSNMASYPKSSCSNVVRQR